MPNSKASIYVLRTLAQRLKKGGYIDCFRVVANYPSFWFLTKQGAEYMNTIFHGAPAYGTFRHNYLATELAVDYAMQLIVIKTEWQLKHEIPTEDLRKVKLPDFVLVDENIAIEVEITKKTIAAMNVVMAKYQQSTYKQIIYYSNNASILNFVAKYAHGDKRFKFKLFVDDAILDAIDYEPQAIDAVMRNIESGFSMFEQAKRKNN